MVFMASLLSVKLILAIIIEIYSKHYFFIESLLDFLGLWGMIITWFLDYVFHIIKKTFEIQPEVVLSFKLKKINMQN